jgi:hypothetical protein
MDFLQDPVIPKRPCCADGFPAELWVSEMVRFIARFIYNGVLLVDYL